MPVQSMLREHLEEKYVALPANKGGFRGVCLHNVEYVCHIARWQVAIIESLLCWQAR